MEYVCVEDSAAQGSPEQEVERPGELATSLVRAQYVFVVLDQERVEARELQPQQMDRVETGRAHGKGERQCPRTERARDGQIHENTTCKRVLHPPYRMQVHLLDILFLGSRIELKTGNACPIAQRILHRQCQHHGSCDRLHDLINTADPDPDPGLSRHNARDTCQATFIMLEWTLIEIFLLVIRQFVVVI
mmetsp:Transcript_1683/g.2650  ORF Transcript_1683/g.2650 Transcript_1683/m.2650 type:complete len:190 (+) Transcript_1683:1880-2449(+)